VAPHKRIRAVRFVDAIPRTPAGKILRRRLRDAQASYV
jgi:acyl-coenzyme A synthetase/AMP-(fatty) acid ligase